MTNPRKEIFNKMADEWDARIILNQDQKLKIEKTVKKVKIKSTDKILDAGCGTGVLINYLLKLLGTDGKITAIDVSDKMIALAKKKHNDRRIDFRASDIYEYDFKKNYYNKIFVFSCFPHLHDKEKSLKIFHEILSDKGCLIIFHLEGSVHMNTFHKSKVQNEILKKDHLPSGAEIKKIIDKNDWKIKKIKDNKKIYLVWLIKK